MIAGRTKTLSPGESYYLHVDLRADEMAPGACRIEAALVSKSRTIGKSQAVTVQCVARESRPQTQGDK